MASFGDSTEQDKLRDAAARRYKRKPAPAAPGATSARRTGSRPRTPPRSSR
ncbi:hypothetical protein GXW82_44575 [Streptacidiphilus sp. 4-A2]|nr:hypothetical protein [Streptacidiphilus sp. 4-A2]